MAVKVNKSGLKDKYAIKCEYCGCEFEYQKEDLGYRLWYRHGFIYCPDCHKPLRHKEEYKISYDYTDNQQQKPSSIELDFFVSIFL